MKTTTSCAENPTGRREHWWETVACSVAPFPRTWKRVLGLRCRWCWHTEQIESEWPRA